MLFQEAQKIIKEHKKHLSQLGVRKLSIFGSIAKDTGKKDSDIDILVDFDSKMGLFIFLDLKEYLENILHCEVDLVTKKALHPALKERILGEAREIF